MTLKMTKSNEVMEFFTIKTTGISLDELTALLLNEAMDDDGLKKMLKMSYAKLMKKVNLRIYDGGMRLFEDDLSCYLSYGNYDEAFAKMKKYLQRSSKKSYLGKTKTQILEEKQLNQDIKSYMQGTQ